MVKIKKYIHGYHIVNNSPWPLTTSISIFSVIISVIMSMDTQTSGHNVKMLLTLSVINLLYSVYKWWREIVIESTYKGEHTKKVQNNIKIGFNLFVISEIVIFMTLFYCLFYNNWITSIETNNELIPVGIETICYYSIPLLNTALLFFGSLTITAAQYYIILKEKQKVKILVLIIIILNLLFSALQLFEYTFSPFTLTDSFFGGIFYFLTGCHALHVIVGTLFLIVAYFRMHHYTNHHHLLLTFSNIYAHLCDIVWLVLFVILYVYLG